MPKNEEYDEPKLLTTVSNSAEADVIISLLKAYDIPVLHKDKEAGGYLEVYMGFTRFAVELYVPSKLFEQAKEILENNKTDLSQDEQIEELDETDDSIYEDKIYRRKRSIISWILIIILGTPILISIAGFIMYLIYYISLQK